ncbi:MAG: ABC transporter substrate-binding protein [Dehalococcoidia bacterium]|nr:ABC transporter substrate-binding protein [Dehalococcoidia bacterium]
MGKESLNRVKPAAPKAGVELVSLESYGPDDKDFAPQLTKIKASGAQAVILYDSGIASALIARQMKSMGINVPWTAPYGILGPANIQAAGDAFDGLTVPAPKIYVAEQLPDSDPQKKMDLQFKESFKKTAGKDPDPLAMHGWDAVIVIAEAIKRTNADPDNLTEARAKIRDGIEGLKDFPAVVSSLTLSPSDHEGMPAGWSALVQVNGGKFSIAK